VINVQALKNDLSNNSIIRLCNLCVRLEGDCIFIAGNTKTYHQKQVAIHIVIQHTKTTDLKIKDSIKVNNV
jgi:hypothetical protein